MDYLRAEYGVLTNGEQFRLYRRSDSRAMLVGSMDSVTESQARDLISALRKREFDLTDPDDVNQFLAVNPSWVRCPPINNSRSETTGGKESDNPRSLRRRRVKISVPASRNRDTGHESLKGQN